MVPQALAPGEEAPEEEAGTEAAGEPLPVAPPPAALPTAPVAPAVLQYLPLPPAFTFLRQDPTYSFYLEQNPLEPPQRLGFRLFGGAEYDSNRDVKTDQKFSDFSGLGTLATSVNLPQRRYFLILRNTITYRHSFRTDTDRLDAVHLNLATGYRVSPRLSLGLTDLFVKSDNRLEQILNQPPGLFVGTQPSTINTVSVSSNYRLSPVSSFVFTLGNSIVRNESSELQDSSTERAGLSFATILIPKLSLGAGYNFSYTSFSRDPSLQSHSVNAHVGYSLDSSTRLIVGAFGTARLRPGPDDSLFYGANVRVERRIFEGIVCFVGVGFNNFGSANEGVRRRYNYNFGCTGTGGVGTSALLTKHLTLDLNFNGQIRDTTDETVAVGIVNTDTASATLRFFPNREFLATLRLSASRSTLLETTTGVPNASRGNTFDVLQGDLHLNYRITTWLSAIGNYTLSRRLVERGTGGDLLIHRAFLGLSASYGVQTRGQASTFGSPVGGVMDQIQRNEAVPNVPPERR